MPTNTSLLPVAGIDNRQEDALLMRGGEAPQVFMREALNVNISDSGRVDMRAAPLQVTPMPYANLWGSPLHGDLFGTLGNAWVKINQDDWTHEVLADLGSTWASHCEVNGRVVVAGESGIFAYDGRTGTRLSLETPGQPFVSVAPSGALPEGDYGVAVAWLRGTLESSVSAITFVQAGAGSALTIGFPFSIDPSVTGLRLYMTKPGSPELHRVGDFDPSQGSTDVVAMPDFGASPEFQHLDAMPPGRFLHHWRGRLVVASTKTLHFSEPMAWHLNDRRHGFVQFPQRITFVLPVDGGLWVGQVDHVVFLSGRQPDEMDMHRRASKRPVPGSAALVRAELIGEASGPGHFTAIWLAENGYVLGTSDGQLIELHRKNLQGITPASGVTTVWGERILTIVK